MLCGLSWCEKCKTSVACECVAKWLVVYVVVEVVEVIVVVAVVVGASWACRRKLKAQSSQIKTIPANRSLSTLVERKRMRN